MEEEYTPTRIPIPAAREPKEETNLLDPTLYQTQAQISARENAEQTTEPSLVPVSIAVVGLAVAFGLMWFVGRDEPKQRMVPNKIRNEKEVEYLAAERRAHLDYAARSRSAEASDSSASMRGRHRRQAESHERKADLLGEKILSIL